jgi:predicted nuclease of predicted toxin-antitoxin system
VRLLLDENLSPRLASRLRSLFTDLTHVRDVGLRQAADKSIWEWARTNGYAVITTDADFRRDEPPAGMATQVIHIEQCDFPFRVIEDLLRRSAVRISEFEKNNAAGVLSLRFLVTYELLSSAP